MSRDRARLLLPWLVGAALAAHALGGCLEPREHPSPRHRSNCTTCHGSPMRAGDELSRSAPPFDLSGRTDLEAPGVGAHLVHLEANDVHGAVACEECHVVPDATDSAGHADTELPAEIVFGKVAAALGRMPSYEARAQRCADTHCHLATSPAWIPATDPMPRCERCHAMPPPPPHPASRECQLCHGSVIDASRSLIAPERHVDGHVDVEERCDLCHGSGPLGAPPPDLTGNIDRAAIGVGAHAAHLSGGASSRPVACGACHLVPEDAGAVGHLDETPRAEVVFGDVAVSGGRTPAWSRDDRRCSASWCHNPSPSLAPASPRWTEALTLGCAGCHGMPPAPPHPQMTACSRCHADVIDETGAILLPLRHVDGIVDVLMPTQCNACHGDMASSAPPQDLLGNASTSARGVGAHRAHVEDRGLARKVLCVECHQVPSAVLDGGHIDTPSPAELTFSGVARAFGASPQFDGARCADSYCHGASFVLGHDSGGTSTEPLWTVVDGSQSTCTGCHGLPPPPPHPVGPLFCSNCHSGVGVTLQILEPDKHVNGSVDF